MTAPGTPFGDTGSEFAAAMDSFRSRMAEIARLQEERAKLTATATAERRRVTVTVNADGVVIETKFANDIDDLSYDEIAKAIATAAQGAQAELARKSAALMAPVTSGTETQLPSLNEMAAGIAELRNNLGDL